jgi:hypothetical protein
MPRPRSPPHETPQPAVDERLAVMQSDAAAEAMAYDGVRADTLVMLVEA